MIAPTLARAGDSIRSGAALAWLFCLLLVLVAPAALRAETYTIPGTNITLSYSIGGTPATATITGCNYDAVGDLVIPDTLGGVSVTGIGDSAFRNRTNLTSVTIPEHVTMIGEDAFIFCTNLTAISMPDNVISIGRQAFAYCANLTSVHIPAGVTAIGESSFHGSGLTSVTFHEGITSIGAFAFATCTHLTQISIPSSVTYIDTHAFEYCIGMVEIQVAAANPNYASRDGVLFNKALNTLLQAPRGISGAYSIPDSVTLIDSRAFGSCINLVSVTIPHSVSIINDLAFSYCINLASITVDPANPNYASAGGVLFDKGLRTLMQAPAALSGDYLVPDTVTAIGDYAFQNCSGLSSVTIPNSVTAIGDYAFSACSSLSDIVIPNGVTSINYAVFAACASLESVTIPEGVTSINDFAFKECTSLSHVTIPHSVTSIGDYAFYRCIKLGAINIPGSVTSIGNYAFNGCVALEAISIPDSVTSIGDAAFAYCSGLTSITIPDSVTVISGATFANCTSLSAITIPESVTSIDGLAFSECTSLGGVNIPASVISIGNSAFSGCSNLTSISFPSSITSIGHYAFAYCTSLTSATFEGDPKMGVDVFLFPSVGFRIHYPFWSNVFSTPTWQGHQTQPYDDGRTAQTINFTQPANRGYGDGPFTLSADASSGLPVTFSVVSGPATLSGSLVTPTSGGIITIRAMQMGDSTWAPARFVDRSFTVNISVADVIEAIDQPGADGAAYGSWNVDTTTPHDGVGAARSGAIAHNSYGVLTLEVSDATSVSFWWKVSSESGGDRLQFSVDGIPQASISGEVDWRRQTHLLAPGPHYIQWFYIKNSSISQGADAGWVDQVVLSPEVTTFEEWITVAGLAGADAAVTADPDDDGLPNLLEYALATSPTEPTGAARRPAVTLEMVSGQPTLVLTHRRRKTGAPSYAYKTSTDLATPLANWSSAALTPSIVDPDADGDDRVEIVAARLPLNGAPKRFLTLSVSE